MFFGASVYAALLAALVAAAASILFLRSRNFFYDSLALAATEIGLVILGAGIVAGTIAGHTPGGLWWTWDARLTAALVCWLLYAPYLMLRNAMEEPTRRAAAAAIVSIFAFFDIPVIALAVHWWLAGRGQQIAVMADWRLILPTLAAGSLLAFLRLRKEQLRRASDAARRTAQEI